MELMGCQNLAVPAGVMHHVVRVESSFNPYAIGVVGGRLARQPANLSEALATVRMLEARGYNFSLGLAQVNRYNLARYGLASYEQAFQACPNLQAGARILAECHGRAGRDWGKSFSCYYSGNFTTGFREGYVQKIYASMRASSPQRGAIPVYGDASRRAVAVTQYPVRTAAGVAAPTRESGAAPAESAAGSSAAVAAPARTSSAPSGADDSARELVVLQRGGVAPREVTVAAPAPEPSPVDSPGASLRDTAFVF